MEEMAARYVDEIRLIQPEGPYVIGGLSYGGYVAFEIAQQLYNQNQAVALLGILDTIAPSCDSEQNERFHDPDVLLFRGPLRHPTPVEKNFPSPWRNLDSKSRSPTGVCFGSVESYPTLCQRHKNYNKHVGR